MTALLNARTRVDLLTALGVVSTGAAIVFYHLEPRHRLWVLGFAAASLSSAVYAFLQGAWPFGVAELFWVGVALDRYALLVRSAANTYVPGAKRAPEVTVTVTHATSAWHCHAGYALRQLESRPQEMPGMGYRAQLEASRIARVS